MDTSRLVYSTDPRVHQKCPRCQAPVSACRCTPPEKSNLTKYKAVLRLATAGRRGKTVTVIEHLPKLEVFLKPLTKELKKLCGAGGTTLMGGEHGVIEIQGDHRERIKMHLKSKGIQV